MQQLSRDASTYYNELGDSQRSLRSNLEIKDVWKRQSYCLKLDIANGFTFNYFLAISLDDMLGHNVLLKFGRTNFAPQTSTLLSGRSLGFPSLKRVVAGGIGIEKLLT